MAYKAELSRHRLIHDILFYKIGCAPLEKEILHYSCEVIRCAEVLLKRELTRDEGLPIVTGLGKYCWTLLKESLIQKTFPIFNRALSNLETFQLINILHCYKRGESGIVHVQVTSKDIQRRYVRPEFSILEADLQTATVEANKKEKEIDSYMKDTLDTIISTPAPLYAINLSGILGVTGKTFEWKGD
jgi:hypothetical protein